MIAHAARVVRLWAVTAAFGLAPLSSARAADEIPRADLQRMYARELEGLYAPADADKVYAAHQLIERYFAPAPGASRKHVLKDLEATGLDANLLGRLTRLRMHWPALEPGGIYYVNERFGTHSVRYFLGVPKGYDRTKPWPLVIKLPGAHAFTTQPPPDGEQVAGIYRAWCEEELSNHPDAAVLMPLLDLGELWGPSLAGMNRVIQPMQHAMGRVNVDVRRVYLVGHSMSAHAAWNLALHHPTYFAAFNPLAGSARADWQRLRLINLRNVLPVVWHDTDDKVIPVERSRSIVRALRGLKLDVEYVETKSVGHVPRADVVEGAYRKMRDRVRDLYPVQVWLQSNRPDTLFNRADWVQVYQPLRPGKERQLLIRRGTGHVTVYDNAYRMDAAFAKANRVEVKAENVLTMRLYFNDRMIDMAQPVTIAVNKKVRFEGLVKPSVEEMLKDQLTIGRGWRYYSGVVDLDLAPPPVTTTKPAQKSSEKPATPKK